MSNEPIDKRQRTNIGLPHVVQTALAAQGDRLRRQIDTHASLRRIPKLL